MGMTTFNIYFSDLNEDAQQRLLARMGCTDPMEMNWDRDIVPLAIFETEDESEPEELELIEEEPYDPGPGERRVEQMIREEEYRKAGQQPYPLNMEED